MKEFLNNLSRIICMFIIGLITSSPFIIAGIIGFFMNCPMFERACYMYGFIAFLGGSIFFSE